MTCFVVEYRHTKSGQWWPMYTANDRLFIGTKATLFTSAEQAQEAITATKERNVTDGEFRIVPCEEAE